MSKAILAALVVAGVVACGGRDQSDLSAADSLDRDLQLAPTDSSAALNDRPSAAPTRSSARPAPAKPAARTLAAGTQLSATTTAEIRSNKNKVGDEVVATVAADVKNAAGAVVIPKGSSVTLQITAIHESENKSDVTGTLTLKPTAVAIGGQSYPLQASIQSVASHLEDRATNAGDVAKVGAGAAAGAVVGRVLGGSKKGAVIGGVIGGAVGAQRAVETQDRDVVVPVGTAVAISLDAPFTAGS